MQDDIFRKQASMSMNHEAGREMKVSLPYRARNNANEKLNPADNDIAQNYLNKSNDNSNFERNIHGFSITDKEFYQLAAYIKNNYGINLKKERNLL